MCVVSMVMDHYKDKWVQPRPAPWHPGEGFPPQKPNPLLPPKTIQELLGKPEVTKEDFDKLKAEVEELKLLIIRAKEYDEKNNEPHCEVEEKVALIRAIAKLVGVDLDEVLKE